MSKKKEERTGETDEEKIEECDESRRQEKKVGRNGPMMTECGKIKSWA